MPTRARLDEFIAVVVSGDHAGAIERDYLTEGSRPCRKMPLSRGSAATCWWRRNAPRWTRVKVA